MATPETSHTAPLRLALVGLGGHGRTIQGAAEEAAGIEVVVVYDPVEAEAAAAAKRFRCEAAPSYEALLGRDDLDAVSICSPNHLHRVQAEAAFEAGLDVLVEKPIANTVADGLSMVRKAEAAGCILMVGHNMRYEEAARRAQVLLRKEAIGEVVSVEVHFSSDTALRLAPTSWRLRPDRCPLLPMMQLGIHGIDLVHKLVGRTSEVYARARSVTTRPPIVDSVAATFTLENGVLGTLVSNYCSPERFAYRIAGTRGTLVGTPLTLDVRAGDGRLLEQTDASDAPFASYTTQLEAFAKAVRSRKPPEADGWCGVQALAVVEAMGHSIERGEPVSIPDLCPQTIAAS
ncbi:MAG: Gfo/Idh/MocA family protein [Rhodothermales bacterium]